MAKIISPFVGSAKGKLGGAVYYSRRGGTFARQRVASVANPQTEAQMITRVILSTVSKAYRLLMPICNHSFQGAIGAAGNHQVFMSENVNALRQMLNEATNPYNKGNFNPKGVQFALINNLKVAKGSLPEAIVHADTYDADPYPNVYLPWMDVKTKTDNQDTSLTYRDILDYYGLPEGAQLTLLMPMSDGGEGEIGKFYFCRIILSPANGDFDSAFIDANGAINSPNAANEGTENFHFSAVTSRNTSSVLCLQWRPSVSTWGEPGPAGFAAIFSVLENGTWKRSDASIFGIDDDLKGWKLGAALESYEKGANSSFYLNGSNLKVTDTGGGGGGDDDDDDGE